MQVRMGFKNERCSKIFRASVKQPIIKISEERWSVPLSALASTGHSVILQVAVSCFLCFQHFKWYTLFLNYSPSVVQSLSCIWLFVTPWPAARQVSLSFTISLSLLELISTELVMPSSQIILWCSLLLLSLILPSIRVFSNELVLHIRWSKYWSFSFGISPSNEYSGLIPLRLTDLISLQSKGLSSVFSNTTVQKHLFFCTQLSLWSNSHIHTWLLGKP